MMGKQFEIKTEAFQGPLDLLLELIEKRKLLINDISLADVTDEYMRSVADMQEKNLTGTSEFVVIASTLLLIKSKSLLPVFELTSDEEEGIEELQDRLKEYQIFKQAAKTIIEKFGSSYLYVKTYVKNTTPHFAPDSYTTLDCLKEAVLRVVNELPKEVVKPKVRVKTVVSLEEMIDTLRQRVERHIRLSFRDFTKDSQEKSTVIVSFLAILEMVKEGSVYAEQQHSFADIEIERETSGVPRYM